MGQLLQRVSRQHRGSRRLRELLENFKNCGQTKMTSSTKKCAIGLSIGSILCLVGILMTQSGDFVFNLILRTQMTLSPNSTNYPLWKDLPMPIKTSMFLVTQKLIYHDNNLLSIVVLIYPMLLNVPLCFIPFHIL